MRSNHVSEALKKLREKGVIEHSPNRGIKAQTVALIADYEQWGISGETEYSQTGNSSGNREQSVTENGNTQAPERRNTTVPLSGNHTFKEKNKPVKERVNKAAYGDNSNVYLSDKEYDELIRDYGQELTDRYIGRADRWLSSAGAKVTDCAALIRKWLEQDGAEKDCGKWKKYEALINLY